MEPSRSAAEKILDMHFLSDPRRSKFELPTPPPEFDGRPFTFARFKVTREMARDWALHRLIVPSVTPRELRHDEFRPNRRIQGHRIRHWSRVHSGKTRDGEVWNPDTPPGLVFSLDGFILDGQHKLAGAILAGVEFEVLVSVGNPWSVLKYMDTPLRRNAGQMTDVPHPQDAAKIARYLLPVIYGDETSAHTMRGMMDEIVQITQTWPWFRNPAWIGDMKKRQVRRFVPTVPLGAVVFGALAAGASAFEVKNFIDGIDPFLKTRTEWDGPGTDPRKLLSDRYLTRRHKDDEDLRSDAGIFRKALTIYLERYSGDKNLSAEKFIKIGKHNDLPPFWNSEAIREFHAGVKEKGYIA